jgi:hypothetical protein
VIYTYSDSLSGMEDACAMSHPGDCTADVAAAVDRLEWIADDDDLRAMLREFGAWDDLADASQRKLRERAAWVAAGDIRAEPEAYGCDEPAASGGAR